jgi:hypothetical protein
MKVLILDKNTHRNRYRYLDSNEIHGRTPKPNGDGFLKVGSLIFSFHCFGVFNKRPSNEQNLGIKKGRISGGLFDRFQTPFVEHSIMQL